jgi:DNA helicase II / ATP-dependent DNA helicase PcrA
VSSTSARPAPEPIGAGAPDPAARAASALLADLTEAQRAAVTSPAPRLAVVAGAGSGKTRVLTRRIAWLATTGAVDPRRTLAVTFTRKAAGELTDRLSRLGLRDRVTAGTFHAMALAQLRRRALDAGRRPPAVAERPIRLVGAALETVRPETPAGTAALVARELDWVRALGLPASQWDDHARRAGRPPVLAADELVAVAAAYEREKRRRGVLDFQDLVEHLAAALAEDPELAAAQRWRHRHLFVDEFQDVSPAQFRLLSQWLGPGSTLTVVGDDRQSIYGFAGGDARYLARFTDWCVGGDSVVLTTNFRSTPQIQAVAAAVLPGPAVAPARTASDARVVPGPQQATEPPDGSEPLDAPAVGGAARMARPDGPWPVLTAYADDEAEARGVAAHAAALVGAGRSPASIAVLVRTNAQTPAFLRALADVGLPVHDPAALIEDPSVVAVVEELRRATQRAPGVPWSTHLRELLDEPGPATGPIRALGRAAAEYATADATGGTLDGFEQHLRAVRPGEDDGDGPSGPSVSVLTFHRAKGLEWPVVFVTGLEDGLVPSYRARTEAARAEEARLLYVALSRAERELHCSWAEQRLVGERRRPRTPSPWVTALRTAIVHGGGPVEHAVPARHAESGPGAAAAALAASRRRLEVSGRRAHTHPVGAPPDELAGRLDRWRRHRARVAGVEPTVVLDDGLLAAIAAARPASAADLAGLGLGPVATRNFGDALLALVGDD